MSPKLCFLVVFVQLLTWNPILLSQEAPNEAEAIPFTKKVRPKSFKTPCVIEFNGPINFRLGEYFKTKLGKAKQIGADLVILEIDSPGGLKSVSLEIAEQLRDVDWAYTVAFVPDEAISGGALVSIGCDEIVIAPQAKFGDIGEIMFDPETQAFRAVPAKQQSFLVTSASNIAKAKGRPPELVEALIDKNVMVYTKDQGGNLTYQTVRVEDPLKPDAPWTLVKESGPERYLTLSGSRAVELGLAETNAQDREELAQKLNFSLDSSSVFQRTWVDDSVYLLNLPFITGLLILVGLLALYFELSAPGLGVGGLIAGLCAGLFFWSHFLGGTSGWLEVLLFVAGLIFLAVEMFIIPGFGVAGLAGLVLLFASVLMACQDFVMPSTGRQWDQLLNNLLMILCSSLAFIISAAFLAKRLGGLPVFNQFVLTPTPDGTVAVSQTDEGKPVPQEHPIVSVGDWGTTESLLRPAGRAMFHGRSVDVVSDGSYVDPDTQVKVIKIQGNVVMVAVVEDREQAN